jgi:hypothetical protein
MWHEISHSCVETEKLFKMITNRKIKFLFAIGMFSLLALSDTVAQSKTKAPKIIAYIIGTWTIQPESRSHDTTSINYPKEITFDVEGKYSKTGKDGEITRGTYRINENTSRIYLDAGQNTKPEEWNVRFKNDRMTLQYALPKAKRYTYLRKGDTVRAQQK